MARRDAALPMRLNAAKLTAESSPATMPAAFRRHCAGSSALATRTQPARPPANASSRTRLSRSAKKKRAASAVIPADEYTSTVEIAAPLQATDHVQLTFMSVSAPP